jgi:hypothetical protein
MLDVQCSMFNVRLPFPFSPLPRSHLRCPSSLARTTSPLSLGTVPKPKSVGRPYSQALPGMLRIEPLTNEDGAVNTWFENGRRRSARGLGGRDSDNVFILSHLACSASMARSDAQFGLFASSGENSIFGNPTGCPDGLK